MALNGIINAVNSVIQSNGDNVYAVKNGKKEDVNEVRAIYQGKTITVWQKQKYYYITFNSNGGTGNMSRQTMPVGVATALLANAFSRLGYLFNGWAKSASGAKEYSDKQSVKDIAAAGTTTILYALWNAITYYIKYNGNGNTGGSMSNSEHKYDTSKNLTANAFTKTGYLFNGWAKSASGSKEYSDGASVKNLASTQGATVNLYALWNAITWYIKFNANGGSGTMANQEFKYDTPKALTANAFSRPGYSFNGWATSASGSKVYNDKQSVKNLKSTHGATLNLYALWTDLSYYAIQNGKLVNAPNASAWSDGYSNGSGTTTDGEVTYYGGWGHTSGDGQTWGSKTGSLATNGCAKLTFTGYVSCSPATNLSYARYVVYKDGVATPQNIWADDESFDVTVDISTCSTVEVEVEVKSTDNSNSWVNIGLVNVRLHN